MKIKELNKEYDKLQKNYGARELNSIYGGGCEDNPEILFVFMNPTGKNIASSRDWNGIRSPWIGIKNIWKLFYGLKLLDENIYSSIKNKRPHEWNEEFAGLVYKDVKNKKYYITNLGKCTQIDARPIPNSVYKEYLGLLCKEIELIRPKAIISFGNQVSSIFLGETINVSKCRKRCYKKLIGENIYDVYPTYYPVGNGMRNIDKALEDLRYILENK